MAVYAFPRATLGIDIMIEPESLPRTRRVAGGLGFSVDTGLMEFKNGAIQICRLCKIPPGSEDELVLALALVTPEIKQMWNSRQKAHWERGTIPVVSPQRVIKLKSMRNSGQDHYDISHLRKIIHGEPDDSSDDEVPRELAFARMVERGLEDSDEKRTISNEEMKHRIRTWGK